MTTGLTSAEQNAGYQFIPLNMTFQGLISMYTLTPKLRYSIWQGFFTAEPYYYYYGNMTVSADEKLIRNFAHFHKSNGLKHSITRIKTHGTTGFILETFNLLLDH
jgi:hypothetical protein